jgi:hypothetical protein
VIPLRCYTVVFAASAQAGAVDWFELIAGSTTGIALLGLDIGQTTELGDAAEEQIDWYIKRGVGHLHVRLRRQHGRRPQPRCVPVMPRRRSQPKHSTRRGLLSAPGRWPPVHNSAFNLRSGLLQFWTPETAFTCSASQALAIGMTGAPADSVTWVGTAYVAELIP